MSAATSAARPAGTATATANATDPWEVTYRHRPGRKTFALISLKPDFSIAPEAAGASGLRFFGSFGEIALSLTGATNKPKATVNLAKGWAVYDDLNLGQHSHHVRPPKRLLSIPAIQKLFLRHHDAKGHIWMQSGPVPTLNFVKEVPSTVKSEVIEVGVSVSDEDENVRDSSKQRRNSKG